jgi:2-amino-4-hydroxy-6-hydroxymethyldihydropteridine diphosphokinase
VETLLSPEALLGVCLGVEAGMGRVRQIRNGPRVIDIDLLLYEGETRNTRELILPHPRMLERTFVLEPLSELAENGRVLGLDVAGALEELKIKN